MSQTALRVSNGPLDMSRFDVTNLARAFNEELKTIKDPRRRRVTITARDHALAECMGDYEALMATCSKRSQHYHVHGEGTEVINSLMPADYRGLEVFYGHLIDSNMYLIHTDPHSFVVGEHSLFMDVTIYQIMHGAVARRVLGASHISEEESEDVFTCEGHIGLMYTFDEEGLSNGEVTYKLSTMNPALTTRLAPKDIPRQFHDGPKKVEEFFTANPDIDWPSE